MTETDTPASTPEASPVPDSIAALEQRLTELETVVHELLPPNHLTAGGYIGEWLRKVGKRLANSL